jgi:hypothetical protein
MEIIKASFFHKPENIYVMSQAIIASMGLTNGVLLIVHSNMKRAIC